MGKQVWPTSEVRLLLDLFLWLFPAKWASACVLEFKNILHTLQYIICMSPFCFKPFILVVFSPTAEAMFSGFQLRIASLIFNFSRDRKSLGTDSGCTARIRNSRMRIPNWRECGLWSPIADYGLYIIHISQLSTKTFDLLVGEPA